MNTSASTAAYTIAASIAIIGNTLLVYAKETTPTLLAAMKATLGHHWTTQAVVIVSTFIVLGFVLARLPAMRRFNGTFLALLVTLATVAGGIGIAAFFLIG
jgi:putative flippase GtrA